MSITRDCSLIFFLKLICLTFVVTIIIIRKYILILVDKIKEEHKIQLQFDKKILNLLNQLIQNKSSVNFFLCWALSRALSAVTVKQSNANIYQKGTEPWVHWKELLVISKRRLNEETLHLLCWATSRVRISGLESLSDRRHCYDWEGTKDGNQSPRIERNELQREVVSLWAAVVRGEISKTGGMKCAARFNFLSNRIVNDWNHPLDVEMVQVKSTNHFKNLIDRRVFKI